MTVVLATSIKARAAMKIPEEDDGAEEGLMNPSHLGPPWEIQNRVLEPMTWEESGYGPWASSEVLEEDYKADEDIGECREALSIIYAKKVTLWRAKYEPKGPLWARRTNATAWAISQAHLATRHASQPSDERTIRNHHTRSRYSPKYNIIAFGGEC